MAHDAKSPHPESAESQQAFINQNNHWMAAFTWVGPSGNQHTSRVKASVFPLDPTRTFVLFVNDIEVLALPEQDVPE